jgi:sugar phosphate isomerase/epimerase
MSAIRLSLAVQTPEVEGQVPVALLSGSFEEKLEKAARFGADGVELMTLNPAVLDAPAIHAQAQRFGLQIAAIASGALSFVGGLTLLSQDPEIATLAQSRLRDLIDLAEKLGAQVVTIGSFRGRAAWGGDGAREKLGALLYQQAEYAAARSVRLALEPLNRYESDLINNHRQGLAFVQEVNHPALGLLLDTYHVNIEESSWAKPFQKAMKAGRLFHVHLGDNNRLPPGDGLIDFKQIVTTLNKSGYQGYLSAELLPKPDPDEAGRRTLAYMREVLRETRK